MRAALILLSLACLCGLAALWQQRTLRELEAGRARDLRESEGHVVVIAAGRELAPGEGLVTIGLPSGAPPVPRPEPVPEPAPTTDEPPLDPEDPPTADQVAPAPRADAEPGDWKRIVESGQVLSRLVEEHYGTIHPDLVQRVAAYNGLANPDDLRAGDTLWLPPVERLRD